MKQQLGKENLYCQGVVWNCPPTLPLRGATAMLRLPVQAADYKASVCRCSLGRQCTVAVYNGVQQRVQLCVSTIQIIGQLCSAVHSVHMVGCKKGGTNMPKWLCPPPLSTRATHPPVCPPTHLSPPGHLSGRRVCLPVCNMC